MGKKKKKKPSTLTKQKWHIWFISLNFALFPSNKIYQLSQFSSVQFSSVTQSCLTLCDPWMAARQASLSITNSRSTLRLTSIESVMPSTISDSVVHFSSCPQSLPASGSFPMSQLFAWGGQSTSWQIDGETVETVSDFILGGSKITADGYWSHEIKRHLLLGKKAWPI